MDNCSLMILGGIFLLVTGIGASVRFRIASLIIPGGLGAILVAIGILLKILGVC